MNTTWPVPKVEYHSAMKSEEPVHAAERVNLANITVGDRGLTTGLGVAELVHLNHAELGGVVGVTAAWLQGCHCFGGRWECTGRRGRWWVRFTDCTKHP